MTETVDQLIRARFEAVANRSDDRDWSDVLGRASVRHAARLRRPPARVALAAVVALLAAAVTAVALGWPQTFVDFLTSPPAPGNVENFFGAENVSVPSGMSPQAIPDQARKITTATFDANHVPPGHPTVHTLYVAPRKGGGFCYLWTDYSGGCADARSTRPVGVDWLENDYAVLASGWVRTDAVKTVEARFADGTTAAIPVTWVSAPISAGFFLYPVPLAHQTRRDALSSVVALDAHGDVVGKQGFSLTRPLDQEVIQTLPDGRRYSLPRGWHAAQARKAISLRSTKGSEILLWLMPRTGGGVCYLFNRGEGCVPPASDPGIQPLNGGLRGGADPVLFFAQTKPEVATVELRYQDGERERLTPVEGFVLTEIGPAHYERGKRLAAAVALDRSGNVIYTTRESPNSLGVYPCRVPKKLGYGVMACP
jgi:hypothetical protein